MPDRTRTFLEEFKAFAMRGNVVDLAVAVVIGAAFGKIVSTLVDNIIMPSVGILAGGVDFSTLFVRAGGAEIVYGAFIQAVVDFLIIAFVIFVAIKILTRVRHKEEKKKEAAGPSEEVRLLREIRDLLRK